MTHKISNFPQLLSEAPNYGNSLYVMCDFLSRSLEWVAGVAHGQGEGGMMIFQLGNKQDSGWTICFSQL